MSQPAIELFQYLDPIIECADNIAFMRRLADESMMLIVTSPPYNIGKSYERRHLGNFGWNEMQVPQNGKTS
jgi:DNA modification methylase